MREPGKKFLKYLIICICMIFYIFIVTACNGQKGGYEIPDNTNKAATDINAGNDINSVDTESKGEKDIKIETSDSQTSEIKESKTGTSETGTSGTAISGDSGANYYYVAGDGVRLREKASTNSNIILKLNLGTKVKYLDREGDWIKVKYDGETGYIRHDLLSDTQPQDISDNEAGSNSNQAAGEISKAKIIIKKSDRILELWDEDNLVGSYPIGLGWDPVGDKQREGDGRTPEGIYYVCTRNNRSRFYLSLGISYPNKEDAEEALEAGLIDQNTFEQIADAIDRKGTPPWNTPMGGEIMIHGHGSHSDWTAGCVAVDNDVMDILWEYCPIGTPIIIEP